MVSVGSVLAAASQFNEPNFTRIALISEAEVISDMYTRLEGSGEGAIYSSRPVYPL